MIKIKLQKGRILDIYPGLGFDVFKTQEISTKIISYSSVKYMKTNQMPEEPKIIQNWKSKINTIKIRE